MNNVLAGIADVLKSAHALAVADEILPIEDG